jgi:hypothetical protein
MLDSPRARTVVLELADSNSLLQTLDFKSGEGSDGIGRAALTTIRARALLRRRDGTLQVLARSKRDAIHAQQVITGSQTGFGGGLGATA